MEDRIVVDVEIKKTVGPPDNLTWNDTDKLGISVAVVYEYRTDRFKVYWGSDDGVESLQKRIASADRVVSFNGERFDFPVIWRLPNRSVTSEIGCLGKCKSTDILAQIWRSLGLNPDQFSDLHKGWGLGDTALATIRRTKIDSGAHAPILWRNMKIGEVVTYCIDDVALTRDLDKHIKRYGYVIGSNGKVVFLKDYE
jgi:hypothetical protein